MEGTDIQAIVRQAVAEFVSSEQTKNEPAYKAELEEERKRREQLERRLNEVVAENQRSRKAAEEAERSSAVRAELQRLGVAKIDLAYRAVQADIVRTDDGRLVARRDGGEMPVKEYLTAFVKENPEFLPARTEATTKTYGTTAHIDHPCALGGDPHCCGDVRVKITGDDCVLECGECGQILGTGHAANYPITPGSCQLSENQ